jgi:hypothetical protein
VFVFPLRAELQSCRTTQDFWKRKLAPAQEHFPALISSAGRQELCAWIERVQIAHNGGALTDRGLAPLRPYLVPLAQEDRVRALRILLSQDARNFLAKIRARWGGALTTD